MASNYFLTSIINSVTEKFVENTSPRLCSESLLETKFHVGEFKFCITCMP